MGGNVVGAGVGTPVGAGVGKPVDGWTVGFVDGAGVGSVNSIMRAQHILQDVPQPEVTFMYHSAHHQHNLTEHRRDGHSLVAQIGDASKAAYKVRNMLMSTRREHKVIDAST